VEMLGTLAIMGVLTIGGIAGYRYAINKSNANTILGAVSQMAVTASTELTTQGSLTLPEWKDANGNLSISGAFGVETARYDDGAFGIIVSNMNDEVCERIKGMDWKVPEDVAINGESDSCDQGEANKIAFVFSNTLTKKSESGEGEDEPQTCALSPCMTCEEDANGNQTHTFLPSGTPCESAGQAGTCDGKGQCKPTGQSCSSVSGCPEGYFCNYGGTKTPNICEKANPKTATINGTTYYFNSASDLRSWCRPADGGKNCTWGYLSYYGAQSWCQAIGKSLLNCSEFQTIKMQISALPHGHNPANDYSYWGQGGECMANGGIYSGRPDGYSGMAGVICK
ncbi:MAG: hypothetical protein IJV07_05010, partial [Alphaproteobacteria bacterium]|nr:hypothetical protein [Alphaproteobacteria bacterium]